MVQPTSIAAYKAMLKCGYISKRQREVFKEVARNPLSSQQEVWTILKLKGKVVGSNGITPRFSELQKLGLIDAPCKKVCSITNQTTLAWEATGNTPPTVNPLAAAPAPTIVATVGPNHKTRAQVAKINDDFLHKAVNELVLVDSITGAGKPLENLQQYDLRVLIDEIHHHLGINSNISGNFPHEGE